MLSNTSKLYFPKLVFDKAVTISNTSSTEIKPLNLYQLNWSRKTSKCSNGYNELLEEYEYLLDSLRFAVSDGYLREIRRCSWSAVAEWNSIRLLDSSMKSVYLLSAASYIETAFKLLSDSLYDEETKYFYRKDDKKIIPYILLYKFWKNQANNSLVLSFVKATELITMTLNQKLSDSDLEQINKFLNFIEKDLGTKNG